MYNNKATRPNHYFYRTKKTCIDLDAGLLLLCLAEDTADSCNGSCENGGDDGHELDEDVDGRARGVLERIANGVADNSCMMGIGALAAVMAGLDELLGVVPGTAGVSHEDSHDEARNSSSAEHSDYTESSEDEACHYWSRDAYACRKDHLLQGSL